MELREASCFREVVTREVPVLHTRWIIFTLICSVKIYRVYLTRICGNLELRDYCNCSRPEGVQLEKALGGL